MYLIKITILGTEKYYKKNNLVSSLLKLFKINMYRYLNFEWKFYIISTYLIIISLP